MSVLPDKVLQRMSAQDRKALGKSGILASEAQGRLDAKSEKVLQTQIVALCRHRNIYCERSVMHKRTTGTVGKFDFDIVLPVTRRHIAVEAKTETGKLSSAQEKFFADYSEKTGGTVYVVRSLRQFKDILDTLTLGFDPE